MADLIFCGYPSAFLYEKSNTKSKVKKQFLWGDTLEKRKGGENGFIEVSGRDETGWILERETQPDQLLDIIFVDVGQGDGCLIVTPDDERIIVDAGKEDNMYRYLKWRYKGLITKESRQMAIFKAAVISHPDADHYAGFGEIFGQKFVQIDALYHNGLFERGGEGLAALGNIKVINGQKYVAGIVADDNALKDFFAKNPAAKKMGFAKFISDVRESRPQTKISMLTSENRFFPDFDDHRDLFIRVLGPVIEKDADGSAMLRAFDNVGKTKNGHSVILMVRYKRIGILLGGDLNIPSEKYLIEHYGASFGQEFQAEVMKSYHHGSGDFSEDFVKAIHPIVTVISSGDNESYSHPRADTLGFIGRWSRSDRPLIFCTELARSSAESVKHPHALRKEYERLLSAVDDPGKSVDERAKAKKRLAAMGKLLNRSVAVYGAINLRTDGQKLVMAQKREARDPQGHEWDIYQLESSAAPPGLSYILPKELRG